MKCPKCKADNTIKWGTDRHGNQRYRCKDCGRTVTDTPPPSPIAPMRIGMERATLILSLLVEGMSVRSAERVTGHHRDTITRLLVLAGEKCEALLERLLVDVEVDHVQADEIWGYVGMKERTKKMQGLDDPHLGDAYTFVAMERESKLVLTHHLGRRSYNDADLFVSKLARATTGTYQLTTDGFEGYEYAVRMHLWGRVDYAMLIKEFGTDPEGQRRYSPPRIIGTEKRFMSRYPDPAKVCTSHIERQNLTMRMQLRRLTRLTNGFSKKWENLRAALALHFAHYNLCRIHSSIRMTPAMKAGVASSIWGIGELLTA